MVIEDIYKKISDMKMEALNDGVPIMQDDTIDFITNFIASKDVLNVLEIGSAVGYSAIMMALSSSNVNVVTIERDKDRYMKALKNIKDFGLEDRITLIFNDALNVSLKKKFDLIVIDAAKGKNKEFFLNFIDNLDINGTVITDNINFHGFTKMDLDKIASRNVRGLVRKINDYIDFLNNSPLYKTKFYDIGDGISVTERSDFRGDISKE